VRARSEGHPNPLLQTLGPDEIPVTVTIQIDEVWPRS
jgi:hypothetical protein